LKKFSETKKNIIIEKKEIITFSLDNFYSNSIFNDWTKTWW